MELADGWQQVADDDGDVYYHNEDTGEPKRDPTLNTSRCTPVHPRAPSCTPCTPVHPVHPRAPPCTPVHPRAPPRTPVHPITRRVSVGSTAQGRCRGGRGRRAPHCATYLGAGRWTPPAQRPRAEKCVGQEEPEGWHKEQGCRRARRALRGVARRFQVRCLLGHLGCGLHARAAASQSGYQVQSS